MATSNQDYIGIIRSPDFPNGNFGGGNSGMGGNGFIEGPIGIIPVGNPPNPLHPPILCPMGAYGSNGNCGSPVVDNPIEKFTNPIIKTPILKGGIQTQNYNWVTILIVAGIIFYIFKT